jgi:hypothetical protein
MCGRELSGNFAEMTTSTPLGIFYMPQIYDMGPTALLPLRRKACWGFFSPWKILTALARFEPANLCTSRQHATPRPPKPLTYLLTHSMEHSPSWEANRFSASKKFPAFYWTRSFITPFTSARHLSLSWVRLIQPMSPHPNFWRSILMLSSHLCLRLPSGLFPSGFPT